MESIEVKTEMSLSVLDQREASLMALAASAKDLTIVGPEDKMGYKLVREKRIELKAERVQVQNDAFDLRENAVKFQKTVIKREKQLVAIISEEENRLSGLEDTYDQWQEEIKRKKDKEENERIQKRVDALAKFGYAIDFYEAKIMEEENFQALLGEAEASYIKEQERIANEKAEADRLKKEEEERMRIEREELARQRAEYEEKEKQFQAKQEAEAKLQRERDERIRKTQEAKEAELRVEREKLEAEKRAIELEKAKAEAAERARIEEQNRIKREAEEKELRDRKAKEAADREEALRPDKEKLIDYAKRLMQVTPPELATPEANKLLREASERIVQTSEYIHDKSKAL